MSQRKNVKRANSQDAYQSWLNNVMGDNSSLTSLSSPSENLLKAEPDLFAVEPAEEPEQLEAAIEVIQEGALMELSPTEQQVFQLYIVEGLTDREVGRALKISREALKYHLQTIGRVLRRQCVKKLSQW